MPVELLLQSGDRITVDTDDLERIDEEIQRGGKLTIADDQGNETVVYSPHVQAAQFVSNE